MEPAHIKRKKIAQETLRHQLLDAALRIANEQSWEAVTIRRIAESVAYTTTIVYSHFDSKEALLQALSDRGFTQLYELFDAAGSKTTDPSEQLLSLSLANWGFAVANPTLYQLMFTLKPPSPQTVSQPMIELKTVFRNLTGQADHELDNLILNWICLRQGCINTLLGFTRGMSQRLSEEVAKDLYIKFIHRFIESIAR